ncbi:hypothetical protein HMPREF1486_04967 [Streptomyces sp. HPH0547]|nr:hypothetical protein HMPREF1486_04967 [Streptomyces sp. HPH0547]
MSLRREAVCPARDFATACEDLAERHRHPSLSVLAPSMSPVGRPGGGERGRGRRLRARDTTCGRCTARLGGSCAGARCGASAHTVDAPGQNLGGGVCVVQGALVGGLPEKAAGIVAGGLGVGERGRQSVPSRAVDDLIRVFGDGLTYEVRMAGRRCAWGLASGERAQGCCCGLLVDAPKRRKGLSRGDGLLLMVALFVPAGRGQTRPKVTGSTPSSICAAHAACGAAKGSVRSGSTSTWRRDQSRLPGPSRSTGGTRTRTAPRLTAVQRRSHSTASTSPSSAHTERGSRLSAKQRAPLGRRPARSSPTRTAQPSPRNSIGGAPPHPREHRPTPHHLS